VAFILFSGDETYSYEQAVQDGATDVLPKPIEIKELALRIEKAIETRRARMEQERTLGEQDTTARERQTDNGNEGVHA